MNPEIEEIVAALAEYKRTHAKGTTIFFTSNGFGKKVNAVLGKVPQEIRIRNTKKNNNFIEHHMSFTIAPIDLKFFNTAARDFTKGCMVNEMCGMGLSRYGYYSCGVCNGIDRVFGFDIGIKELSRVSAESLAKQRDQLCKYCGIFLNSWVRFNWPLPQEKIIEDYKKAAVAEREIISESWKTKYASYSQEPRRNARPGNNPSVY